MKQNKAITQDVNKPIETLVSKQDITVREASYGVFTFVNMPNGGIIIERNDRNQQLTLERQYINDLLGLIPIIREMFGQPDE